MLKRVINKMNHFIKLFSFPISYLFILLFLIFHLVSCTSLKKEVEILITSEKYIEAKYLLEEEGIGDVIEKDNLNDEDNTKADLSTESEIQQPKQSGYCYIGTDRTFRSCVKMNVGDTCASKQVFPTKDICINPELRR